MYFFSNARSEKNCSYAVHNTFVQISELNVIKKQSKFYLNVNNSFSVIIVNSFFSLNLIITKNELNTNTQWITLANNNIQSCDTLFYLQIVLCNVAKELLFCGTGNKSQRKISYKVDISYNLSILCHRNTLGNLQTVSLQENTSKPLTWRIT